MENQVIPQPNNPQPFFETLQQEMERVIDRFRFNPVARDTALRLGVSGQMVPAIDVSETEDNVEITAEVPGVSSDKLDITINGELLTLKGEKADEREKKEKNYHLVERSYGHFQRTIPLGFVPDDDAVTAVFENGVLKLTVRKSADAKTTVRKIAISNA